MIKRITTLALIVANRAKALNPNVNLRRIKKSALFLIIATLFLLPTSYALQQKLVVNFRSPPIGAEVPPLPPGPGTYDPGKSYTHNQVDTKFYGRVGLTDEDDGADPPFVWSKKHGIAEAGPIYAVNQTPYPGAPMIVSEHIDIGGLPGITGMRLDDLTGPYLPGVGLRYGVTGATEGHPATYDSEGLPSRDGVTVTMGPETKHDSVFGSFSQPVDLVTVGGFNGSYAIAGFTKSVSAQHVPDGGSTLVLFAAGLLGLIGVKIQAKKNAAI